MSSLERRLAKIEAFIKPAPALQSVCLMAQPRSSASDEVRAKYIADIAKAVADGYFVIELVSLRRSS